MRNLDGGATTTQINDSVSLNWNSGAFTSPGVNQYEFNGSFTYSGALLTFGPADPDAPFGAYFLGVGLSTQTSNVGGTSTADAFTTLTLDSITLPDGSIIISDLYSFESGTALSSIPVPASWLLLLSGIVFLLPRLRTKQAASTGD